MGDLVERLQRLGKDSVGNYGMPIAAEAANEIESLRSALAKSASREAALVEAIDCCYRMLISEADTRHALFKAENILRDAIAKIKIKEAS